MAMRKQHLKLDWEMFANSLGHKELMRLDKMNIDYHIPVPGARLVHDRSRDHSLTFNTTVVG